MHARSDPPASPGRPSTRAATDPRRTLGRLGEDLAAAHLRRLGYRLLARNVRTRQGEIDLIVCDRRTLVFVEVKARRAGAHRREPRRLPEPLAWFHPRQRARLRRLAAAWLRTQGGARPRAREVRFDAVGVTVDGSDALLRLDHLEGAW